MRVMRRRTHGWMRQCMKPSITTCPASVPVMVLLWPLASSATANSVLAKVGAQQGRQSQIGDPNPIAVGAELNDLTTGNGHAFLAEEDRRRKHQNRRVDEECDGQGHRGVDGVELDRAPDGRVILLQLAALHQGRVQVQVVRHYGGADDADGDVDHPGLTKVRRNQRSSHFQKAGLGLRENKELDEVADGDGGHQKHDHRLDGAHPEALQGQKQQYVQAGDDDRPQQRNMKQAG